MKTLDDYDPEPLVEAVTALDWSTDHPAEAMRAVQSIVQIKLGEELSAGDAMKLVGHLIDRHFIETRIQIPLRELASSVC